MLARAPCSICLAPDFAPHLEEIQHSRAREMLERTSHATPYKLGANFRADLGFDETVGSARQRQFGVLDRPGANLRPEDLPAYEFGPGTSGRCWPDSNRPCLTGLLHKSTRGQGLLTA